MRAYLDDVVSHNPILQSSLDECIIFGDYESKQTSSHLQDKNGLMEMIKGMTFGVGNLWVVEEIQKLTEEETYRFDKDEMGLSKYVLEKLREEDEERASTLSHYGIKDYLRFVKKAQALVGFEKKFSPNNGMENEEEAMMRQEEEEIMSREEEMLKKEILEGLEVMDDDDGEEKKENKEDGKEEEEEEEKSAPRLPLEGINGEDMYGNLCLSLYRVLINFIEIIDVI